LGRRFIKKKKKKRNAYDCFDVKTSTIMHDSVTSCRFFRWGGIVNDVEIMTAFFFVLKNKGYFRINLYIE
jgi:hypothetical protein